MQRINMARRTFLPPAVVLSVVVSAIGCSGDRMTAPPGPTITVCHLTGSAGGTTEIPLADLAKRRSEGDYVVQLEVSSTATTGDSIHFNRLTDAINVARAIRIAHNELEKAACRISIAVASGTLAGSTAPSADPTFERFPFVIDVPDITVQGALKMQLDSGGRATGTGEGTDATIFAPNPALVVGAGGSQVSSSEPIFVVNAHPTGSKGDGAIIEGFVFRSGRDSTVTPNGGQGVFAMRVHGLVIRGNKFENGFTETVDLRASSAVVEQNHLSGRGNTCDICVAGPGDYVVRDNRLAGPGGLPGILTSPALILPVPAGVEQYTLPPSVLVTAAIDNNEVRNHASKPVGVGIRVGAIALGAQDVVNASRVTVTHNTLVGNTFGVIIDAAFPIAGKLLRGDIDVSMGGNTLIRSCQADLFVSFTRQQSGLGLPSPYPSYLLNSTYTLNLGLEFPPNAMWYANPPGYGNTLVVNGQTKPNNTQTGYDATRVCP